MFSIVTANRLAADGGRQIDAGSWSPCAPDLHACFMRLHAFMVRPGCSAKVAGSAGSRAGKSGKKLNALDRQPHIERLALARWLHRSDA